MENSISMTYRQRITPWIVVRLLPNMQRTVTGRFQRRSDAEGHLQFLQRYIPDGEFRVIFDCPLTQEQMGDRIEE